jgi:hypothetical protein
MRAQRRNGGLKTNIWKRTLAGILLTALTVTALPSMALSTPTRAEAASAILKNPRIVKDDSMDSGQKVTWDCIWFGSYPQREIVEDADTYAAIDESYYNPQTDIIEDASLFQKLENTSGWNDNEIILDGEKYRRMKKGDALCSSVKERNFYHWNDSISWHYFKYEPIKWRVLNVKGNSAFIQTDVAIDDQEYSAYGSNSAECFTWNMSNIRSWLNGYSTEQNQIQKDYCNDNFLEDAFNYIQVKAIQLTEIGKDSGENEKKVIDKIFLLSDQITFANYGFRNNYANDEARLRKSSTYAKARGVKSSISSKAKYVGNCCWWGHAMKYPKQVNGNGEVSVGHMYFDMCGVVPALNFDVSNTNLWSYAGTVCSDGTVNEQAPSGSGGNSGETPDTGGNSGETEEADKNRKLYLDVSSLSGKFFRKGQTKSLPFYFYAETEEKLKELIGSLSWTDKKNNLTIEQGAVVMANAPENIGLMEEVLVWKAYGKIDVTADKTGETTIVGKTSDGTIVKQKIKIDPALETEEDSGGSGGGGALQLGDTASGKAGGAVVEFFPDDFNMSFMLFPVEASKEEGENGQYKIKVSVGIGRKDLLDKDSPTLWNQYKKYIEDYHDEMENFDKMSFYYEKWGIKSVSKFKTKKFETKPKVSVVGYLENTYDKNGNLINSDGKINAAAKWSGSLSWQTVTPIGPWYLNLKADGKISGKAGPVYDWEKKEMKLVDGNLKLIPKITVEGGYGIEKVIAAGAYGEASVPVTLIPVFKGEFTAAAGYEIQAVMLVDYKKELAKCTIPLWGPNKNQKQGKTLQISKDSMKEIDTAFAKDTSAWNGGTNRKTRSTKGSTKNVTRSLQQSVLPSTLPIQARINGKDVMVFQAYDENRSTLNSTVLKYSVCENGIWSEPKAVYDDGYADSYADMKVINGKLVLAWQKVKKKITGSVELDSTGVFQQMAENAEIYYAEFDETTGTFRNITQVTNNADCDMMPRIIENGDEIVVAWVRNDAKSLMQEEGTNSICMAKRSASGFEKEEILTTASGTIDNYMLYQDETGIQSAFVGESNQVKAVFDTNGNVFQEFAELMTEADDGTITSLHCASGKIGCILNGKLYQYDIVEKKLEAYDAGEDSFGGQVRYCRNGEKEGYIWSIYDQDTNTGKMMASMKTENGYSTPIILREEKNKMWRYFSPLLDEEGKWTVVTNVLDTESNRNELVYIEKEQQKKLEVDSASIDETDVVDGLTAVRYLVTNTEDVAVENMDIEIRLEDGSKVTKTIPVHLEPGESSAGTAYVDLSEITGSQNASLCITAEGQDEKEENTLEVPVGRADIAVEASAEEKTNQVHVTVNLKNQSTTAAKTDLILYADADKTKVMKRKNAIEIPENSETKVTLTVDKNSIVYNENNAAYLTAYAEVQGGDSEEGNNTAYAVLYKPKSNIPPESERESEVESEKESETVKESETSKESETVKERETFKESETIKQTESEQQTEDQILSKKQPGLGETIRTRDASYCVIQVGADGNEVKLEKLHNKATTIFGVPLSVRNKKGKVFRVTEIGKNAFKKTPKLRKVIIGKNVRKIGANAFYGCKNLKNIKIKSTSLTKKSVGKNVFKGIHKKAVIKVPKKKLKDYKKILKGKGQAKSVKIKK